MCAQFRKQSNVNHVVSQINTARNQQGSRVSYDAMDFSWYKSALETNVEFHHDIPLHVKSEIIRKVLSEPTKTGRLTRDFLINRITECEKEYINRPVQKFLTRMFLSIRSGFPFRSLRLGNAQIDFSPSRYLETVPADRLQPPPFHGSYPEDYQSILVQISAKNKTDAVHEAIEIVDTIRGLWNIFLNPAWRPNWGLRRTPINQITRGPFFTIHAQNGRIVDKGVWHDPAFIVGAISKDITQHQEKLRKETLVFQRRLHRSHFKLIIQDALSRYARALDHIDYEQSVLELWSIVETLTMTDEHRKVVERASSIFKDQEEARAIIDHVRLRRNQIVHRSRDFLDAEDLILQIKKVVESFILIYMSKTWNRLATKNDVATFLDLPRDRQILRVAMRFAR
jgi:hypothetical protein